MLAAGTRLGDYEIVSSLGGGGMGEVYRARDPRLDREVAIKVVAASRARDPGALARFEREAMSIAKLSHPNIVSIFAFGQELGRAFVVTELVHGETLRTRLYSGALPSRRALKYALQIARGIAAAHARGIVHRDLKPENVMLTREDEIKILDFGLAKSLEKTETEMTQEAALGTTAGTVLGTFAYMAPEQVRGLAVDHRADVFAFGAVLYEMLSGERAFTGDTAADTMSAILMKDPPDMDTARLSISPALERIVRRCLEKDPELRFQSANDLAFALETLATGSTASSVPVDVGVPASRHRARWLPWAIGATALVVAATAAIPRADPDGSERRWDRFTRISEAGGEETSPTLFPDGNTVAYAARDKASWDIYSQRVGGRNATPIINDPQRDEGAPAFSPDGSLIAFHESDDVGGIFVAGATGESVRRVTDVGFEPAWSPDGKHIAFTTEEIRDPASRQGESILYVVEASGGVPRKVVDGDAAQASWSPSGGRVVYWSNTGGQRDIYTVPASGGMRVPVTDDPALDWSPVWSPDGRFIYFSSDRGGAMNLWRIAVDQSSGRPLGAPEAVTAGVQASAALPRFSKDGSRLAFTSRVASINPVAIAFDPVTTRAGVPITLDTRNSIRVPSDVSPDGQLMAYFNIGERQEDIFIGSPDGAMRRVTDDPARDRGPMFTPDGRSLVFYGNRDGDWALWIVGIDGGGLRKLTRNGSGVVYPLISPDGDRVIYTQFSTNDVGAFSVPLAPGDEAPPTRLSGTTTPGKQLSPIDWSPDGAHLAGLLMSATGRPSGVGVYDLAAQTTTELSADETYGVRWLSDSRRVIFFSKNGAELVVVDTGTRKRTVVDVRLPGPSTKQVFTISRDSRTIYYGAERAEADIWMVERP